MLFTGEKGWARSLASTTARHPVLILLAAAAATVLALVASSGLEVKLNMVDMLPSHSPVAQSFLEVQERFGEPNTIIVLEGERDRIVAMAEVLQPRLLKLDLLYNSQAKAPVDFLLNHGFVLLRPNQFERALETFDEPDLVGVLGGMNDDYEREYTSSEDNLRRDEVEVAQSLLGLNRSLEILEQNLTGAPDAPPVGEAVDAMLIGDPWLLSLDRRMLLIICTPYVPFTDNEGVIEVTLRIMEILDEMKTEFPDVEASLTGAGPLQYDEINSLNLNAQLLSLLALVMIYLLLARSFRGWVLPLIALLSVLVGIIWTLGVLKLLFGALNIFTAMIMLILLGLGIDFAIHLVSRFYDERSRGANLETVLTRMFGGTGTGVLTGGLTTAAAFFALMIADTRGVFQLGASSGLGMILTLTSVFTVMPAMLVLRERSLEKRALRRGDDAGHLSRDGGGWPFLGRIAASTWKLHVPILIIFAALAILSTFAAMRIGYEYDLMEMEPEGLKSVKLQREIPKRFGITDQGAWLIAESIEESRELKEELRRKPAVGTIRAISDFIPNPDHFDDYAGKLESFRQRLESTPSPDFDPKRFDAELAGEIERLWDNLDLISNLAFQAGLDRIVRSIDRITGYDSKTDAVDESATLPSLSGMLGKGVDGGYSERVSRQWRRDMQARLLTISNPAPVSLDELPTEIKKSHLPRNGEEGFLIHITARDYLFDRDKLDRFINQTDEINPNTVGTQKLFVVVMDETLSDGAKGSILALTVIFVLLLLHFRSPVGLLAAVPLIGAVLLTLGIMYIIGMKFNYMNLIAVPIILGIGIDDGVHALHRWREEAKRGAEGIFESYRYVGKAILLTTMTTMIGFGNLAFYSMPAISGFGIVLFIGIGVCFATTLLVLPAVLRLFTREPPASVANRRSQQAER